MSEVTLRHGLAPWDLRGWNRLSEALQGTSVGPIAALQPGLVQVEGWARATHTINEPRTHSEVIGYRMVVDGLEEGGQGLFPIRIWRLLFDASEVASFVVEDASGSIHVDARDALLLLDYTSFDQRRIYDVMDIELIEFWERHGLTSSTLATARALRLIECRLKPDTGVFVFGMARPGERTVPGTGTYRDAPRPELSIGPFPSRGVIISDRRREDVLRYILTRQGKQLLPRASYLPGL